MKYILAILLVFIIASSTASTTKLVINEDLGGMVKERIALIASLRASNTKVEIQGTCMSACTMFLGMPNTCVYDSATLGFHGPTTPLPGIPLPKESFEYWSQQMASYYPDEISSWFLRTARYAIDDMILLRGTQVIKMGAKACK